MWKGPVAQTLYTASFTRQVAYPRDFLLQDRVGKRRFAIVPLPLLCLPLLYTLAPTFPWPALAVGA